MKSVKVFLFTSAVAIAALISGCSGMLDIPRSFSIPPGLTLGAQSYMVLETGTLSIPVTLDRTPTADVTVALHSSNTSEATISTPSLTFTASNWNIPQFITVSGVNDQTKDGNKEISLVFGAATSADPYYNGYVKPPVKILVIDVNTIGISVYPTSGLVTTELGGMASFSVVLSSRPTGDVTIPSVTSSIPTEGTSNKSSLVFTPADWNVPQVVTITGVDDAVRDGNQVYRINLGNSTSTDNNYSNITPAAVSVTNIDNETPAVEVSNLSNNTTENGLSATFTVRLRTMPANNVTITINENFDAKNNAGQEGTIDKHTLVFTPGDWNTAQTVTVTGVNDDVMDGMIQYVIRLNNASSSDPDYSGMKPDDVTVNNIDNDIAGFEIVVNGGAPALTSNGSVTIGGMATDDRNNLGSNYSTFSIKLRSKPLAGVRLNLSSSSTTGDGVLNKTYLDFTTVNWNIAQTVSVTGASNNANEGNHDYSIIVGIAAADAACKYATWVGPPRFNIHSCDNDRNNLIIACRKSGSFSTSEGGGTAKFWLITQSAPSPDVTVTALSSDTTEGNISGSATATITGSNWNQLTDAEANMITVAGVDDPDIDGNIQYYIIFGVSAGGLVFDTPSASIWNIDNEQILDFRAASGNTTEMGGTAIFGVRLGMAPTADVTFTVACKAGDTECESVSPGQVTYTPANWNVYKDITVTGKADARVDGDSPAVISFGPIESLDNALNEYKAPDISPMNNTDADKLVWITSNTYLGNFNAVADMSAIDAVCQSGAADPNAPANVGSVTYKALIAHNSYRRATTNGINTTGQIAWVLKANTSYYLKDAPAGPYATRVLTTNSYGFYTLGNLLSALAPVDTDEFWTGLNTDWTTSANNCGNWQDRNSSGQYGRGSYTDYTSINYASASCHESNAIRKKIICVQQ